MTAGTGTAESWESGAGAQSDGADASGRALQQTAAEVFGWTDLRADQLAAMTQVMRGRDVIAVLPTGAGKSAIYQVPALLIPGPTLVVSPLLALQHDQIETLDSVAAPAAVALNSDQRVAERRRAWQQVQDGTAEYVFLSPEQLAKDEVVERLRAAALGLIVIDEAHCVSAWGHDFRPHYLRLGQVIERLGHPPVIALTATAAPPVRADIVTRLGLSGHEEVVAGFDRPELRLAAVQHGDERRRRDAVVRRVAELLDTHRPRLGLVYTSSRNDAEGYAEQLTASGIRAAAYHAGMRKAERQTTYDDFRADRLEVVVATSAFGMGIDKPDVRFVVHAAAPESIDAYYQQIGRAGRDGRSADVELHCRPEDLHRQRFLTAHRAPDEALTALATTLATANQPLSSTAVGKVAAVASAQRTRAVNLLEQAGAVTSDARGRLVYVDRDLDPQEAVRRARGVAETHERMIRSRIEMMREYVETSGCRRQFLLGYFGEQLDHPCGNCDRCEQISTDDERAQVDTTEDQRQVRHPDWGRGLVMSTTTDRVTVLFEEVGYKTLALSVVEERNLLSPVEATDRP